MGDTGSPKQQDNRILRWDRERIHVQPADAFPLMIESRFDKPFLKPGSEMTSGTTIRFEGKLYEVVEKEASGDRFWYRCQELKEGRLVRNLTDYTEENHLLFVNRLRRDRAVNGLLARLGRGIGLTLSLPLLGFLPVSMQREIEHRTGTPATRMSLVGGLVGIVIGMILTLFSMGMVAIAIRLFRSIMGAVLVLFIPLYVLLASCWRIISAWVIGEPTEPAITAWLIRRIVHRKSAREDH